MDAIAAKAGGRAYTANLTENRSDPKNCKFRSSRKFNAAAVAPSALLPRFNTIC